jgi:hypothetical protein
MGNIMEAFKQIITVPASRELRIQLPDAAAADEEAEVIVLFKPTPASIEKKLAVMREAASDELYLADLNEATEDFKYTDAETHAI